MYAIFEDGSHQYRVREGDLLVVDRRDGEPGDEVQFDRVLLVAGTEGGPAIGTPQVEGARVIAQIVEQYRAKKIIVQKFKRRKNVRRRKGHRQPYTRLRVTRIAASD